MCERDAKAGSELSKAPGPSLEATAAGPASSIAVTDRSALAASPAESGSESLAETPRATVRTPKD